MSRPFYGTRHPAPRTRVLESGGAAPMTDPSRAALRRRILCLCGFAAAAALLAACSTPEPYRRLNVVLITADTLRAGPASRLRLRPRRDPVHRCARRAGRRVRAGPHRGPAHAAGALVDVHRHLPDAARREGQRRLLPRRRAGHARGEARRRGLLDRRLRLRLRARRPLGTRPGFRSLLRRLRLQEVRQGRARHSPASRRRGGRRSTRVDEPRLRVGRAVSSPGSTCTTSTRPTSRRSPTARATRATRALATTARSPTSTASSAG